MVPAYVRRSKEYVESDRYAMRNIGKFSLACYNKTHTQNQVFFNGLLMYNNLQEDIRTSTNLNEFKKRLNSAYKRNLLVKI